ncbi:hypothetical protein GQX74_013071, partial [Glossina fuscipes]
YMCIYTLSCNNNSSSSSSSSSSSTSSTSSGSVVVPEVNLAFGLAWLGLAWLGFAWLGLGWLGSFKDFRRRQRNSIFIAKVLVLASAKYDNKVFMKTMAMYVRERERPQNAHTVHYYISFATVTTATTTTTTTTTTIAPLLCMHS